MNLHPIDGSSNVAAAGIDAGTMRVRFHDGSEYEYPNVTEAQFQAFLEAPSKGAWLQEFVTARSGKRVTKKPEIVSDKFHTTQAEGCCKKHLNNASLSGALDKAQRFECPKCGTEFLPKAHGPLTLWEGQCDVLLIRR
jgi:hypothetical protein